MAERKAAFEEKEASISNRIGQLSKSKERLVSGLRLDHENRHMKTQIRFKSNLSSYADQMQEKLNKKLRKTEIRLSEIRDSQSEEWSKKKNYKQNVIEKTKRKNEEILEKRKQEIMQKNEEVDRRSSQFFEKKEKERLMNIELEAIKHREREEEAKRLARVKEYERL